MNDNDGSGSGGNPGVPRYFNKYLQNQKANPYVPTSLYDHIPSDEYAELVRMGIIDPQKLPLEGYVEIMGPLWEAEFQGTPTTERISKTIDAVMIGLAAGVGVSEVGMLVDAIIGYRVFDAASKESVVANKEMNLNSQLQAEAAAAKASVQGSGPIPGTLRHTLFKKAVEQVFGNNPLVKTEVSYLNRNIVDYGTRGSVRLDVAVYNPDGSIKAIYDLKTGGASLSASRIRQIQQAVGRNVPVIQL